MASYARRVIHFVDGRIQDDVDNTRAAATEPG